MTSFDADKIGERVAKYRRRNGWTMEDLAARTDGALGKSVIANIESGRKSDISVSQLVHLALALEVEPSALLADLDDLAAPAGIAIEGRQLTGLGFAQWLTGSNPVRNETTPAGEDAGRVLDAIRSLGAAYLPLKDEPEAWADVQSAWALADEVEALRAAEQRALDEGGDTAAYREILNRRRDLASRASMAGSRLLAIESNLSRLRDAGVSVGVKHGAPAYTAE